MAPGREAAPRPAPGGEAATATRLAPVVRLAPAKLNLTLAIIGVRPDGYHALHSVFVPLALADRLSLAPAAGGQDTLHVTGFDAGPAADNLVFRALAATRARSAVAGRAVPDPRRRSPRGSTSGSPSRQASPAGRRTRPPRSTARSRRGAQSSTEPLAWPSPSASDRTSRSSSQPGDRRSSRVAGSTSRRSRACTGARACCW